METFCRGDVLCGDVLYVRQKWVALIQHGPKLKQLIVYKGFSLALFKFHDLFALKLLSSLCLYY
jgi:hypothetical protein